MSYLVLNGLPIMACCQWLAVRSFVPIHNFSFCKRRVSWRAFLVQVVIISEELQSSIVFCRAGMATGSWNFALTWYCKSFESFGYIFLLYTVVCSEKPFYFDVLEWNSRQLGFSTPLHRLIIYQEYNNLQDVSAVIATHRILKLAVKSQLASLVGLFYSGTMQFQSGVYFSSGVLPLCSSRVFHSTFFSSASLIFPVCI